MIDLFILQLRYEQQGAPTVQVATRSVPNDKKDRIDELSDDMVNDFVATQPIVNINGHAYDLVDTTPCEYYEGVKHYKPVLRSAINGHLLPTHVAERLTPQLTLHLAAVTHPFAQQER